MKILIIPQMPTLYFGARGYILAKHLIELGYVVHFIVWDPYPRNFSYFKQNLSGSLKYIKYVQDGITFHKIRRLPFFFPLVNSYLFKKFVSNLFETECLDIVISESFFNEVEPPLHLPLVYDFMDHTPAYMNIYAGSIERFGLKYILNLEKSIHAQMRHAEVITVVSDILMNYIKKVVPETPVYKIPNGVDTLFLEASLNNTENLQGKHSMVYVSHFTGHANLPKLLEAMAILRKRSYPDIELVLVGDGTEIPDAKKHTAKLGLSEHVSFLGMVERERVVDLINGCEIALSPCKKDLLRDSAFPMKIMEYTALGKKIVSSDLEEVKSLHFPNIILYDESKGVEELAEAIATAFATDIDPHETRKLAYNYTWKGIAMQFHTILEEIIAQRKN